MTIQLQMAPVMEHQSWKSGDGATRLSNHRYKHLAGKITSLQTSSFGDDSLRFFLERCPLLSGRPISGPKGTKYLSETL